MPSSADFVESPIGQVLGHQHRSVVVVDGRKCNFVVWSKTHNGCCVTGRQKNNASVLASHAFMHTAGNRRFVVVLTVPKRPLSITSNSRRVGDNYLEAVPQSTVFERYLHSTIWHDIYNVLRQTETAPYFCFTDFHSKRVRYSTTEFTKTVL